MMRVLALFLCILAVASCSPAGNDEWEDFKNNFGKSYDTPEEESYRKTVFEANSKTVKEHNALFQQGLETFDLKINEYGDLTNEEFRAQMNGFLMKEEQSSVVFEYDSDDEVAPEVDWRTKGAVTPVKNQAACGSCWAFSTTGSLEGQHFLKTKKLVSLSEQNLVDCSKDFGNMGCGGGLMDQAFRYIKHNKGIDTEESYPYEAQDGTCRFKSENVGATLTGYVDIPKGNETALLHAVHDVGPISVAIDASSMKFQMYNSGVYDNPDCSSTFLDHGVLAVGYGEEGGHEYWLVKNSWGASWGEEGYIKMSRNKENQCGIATASSYPLV
ncbi:procathepsin L-like [Macrobrachium rosenbergii]|uniref:procathepsin L-like n=1 Tax=Macrobrachium rosenbergii TaxID=79674 RepID=UPI0034D64163